MTKWRNGKEVERWETHAHVPAQWSDDCQGKQDFDGDLVRLSTRYWPGSYQRDGKPSAHAAVHLVLPGDEYRELIEERFVGDTEAEVHVMVERWAVAQHSFIASNLASLFRPDGPAPR